MKLLSAKGSCVCGAVTLSCTSLKPHVGCCHCNICRKWASGPLFYVECESSQLGDSELGDKGYTLNGEQNISLYRSSGWAERGFCKTCGSNIYYRDIPSNQLSFSAGLFASDLALSFNMQLFIDDKPSYFDFENKTQTQTYRSSAIAEMRNGGAS